MLVLIKFVSWNLSGDWNELNTKLVRRIDRYILFNISQTKEKETDKKQQRGDSVI